MATPEYFSSRAVTKAKARAALEDELTGRHGIKVTILDRSWIMQQVIELDRKDLAYNYLRVGQEVVDARRLGPVDYSRTQQLEGIEELLSDPGRFAGTEWQGGHQDTTRRKALPGARATAS